MSRTYEIPKSFKDMIGTKQVFSGGLFSWKKDLPEQEYEVHDVRWGSAIVVNWQEMVDTGESKYEHPTVELLISNRNMKRKRWTRGFAVREINLKGDKP